MKVIEKGYEETEGPGERERERKMLTVTEIGVKEFKFVKNKENDGNEII